MILLLLLLRQWLDALLGVLKRAFIPSIIGRLVAFLNELGRVGRRLCQLTFQDDLVSLLLAFVVHHLLTILLLGQTLFLVHVEGFELGDVAN